MLPRLRITLALALLALFAQPALAVQSVARQWNEVMLSAIRKDLARPPVQARNLFHFAIAAYDSWAAYDNLAQPYLLGRTVGGFYCPFNGIAPPADIPAARNQTISYACYRLLRYRYLGSPDAAASLQRFDDLMATLGYNKNLISTDYSTGSAAALGNYIAQCIIDYGMQDGANEAQNYAIQYYTPVNPPLIVKLRGDSTLVNPNRWQPLTLTIFIDQSGNIIPGLTPKFLSPEWGGVTPFALTPAELTLHPRDGFNYPTYDDPGPPPMLDTLAAFNPGSMIYKWGFELVSVWSSHLKSADPVLWDISPASRGNNPVLPTTQAGLQGFYNLVDGGDTGTGRALNPRTGLPYTPQIVPRGDYTRVLAEFWADGPSSETPPGHWFTILNYVSDQPSFVKRLEGAGPVLDDLEWDVKAYLTLGGAEHDAAIACWGIKGAYDYIRPISAIRWMAGRGQSSNSGLPHYSPVGIPLLPGYIELVQPGDPLSGAGNVNVNKIKLYAWRGPDYIAVPASDTAGVGWILAENWYPYQRPSFVTPPFAGYTSGHSTYSRAGAEVMTRLTGDEYFPGGIGTFPAPMNQYLVFEDGPSVDVTLQWATYRDASDQCSLSRIWGGIHPPQDDIPGRLIGKKIGINAVNVAESYFAGAPTAVLASLVSADTGPGFVRLAWQIADPRMGVTLCRHAPGREWEPLAALYPDGSGEVDYVDRDVVAGERYGYRLIIGRPGAEVPAGETWLSLPSGPLLAISGTRPNPIEHEFRVLFTLPDGVPARLEVFDVTGRQVAGRDVGSLGPGQHLIRLEEAERAPTGVYLMRLTQAGRAVTGKACVLR